MWRGKACFGRGCSRSSLPQGRSEDPSSLVGGILSPFPRSFSAIQCLQLVFRGWCAHRRSPSSYSTAPPLKFRAHPYFAAQARTNTILQGRVVFTAHIRSRGFSSTSSSSLPGFLEWHPNMPSRFSICWAWRVTAFLATSEFVLKARLDGEARFDIAEAFLAMGLLPSLCCLLS